MVVGNATPAETPHLARIWYDAHAATLPAEIAQVRTLDSFAARLVAALPTVGVTGAAAALISAAEVRLAATGVRVAWVACAIGNDWAARFCEKSGWRRAGTVVSRLETGGGTLEPDVWRYEKALR